MPFTIEDSKNIAAAAQSVATIASFLVGGVWVYMRYIRQQERYPNIEFSADIHFIGVQDGFWVAELIATIENKGKAQHRMEEFCFDLNAIEEGAPIRTDQRWGNQVDFPMSVAKGSFLPAQYKFFFIDPGIKAKYSHLTRIPIAARFVILHCWFKYADGRTLSHTAERTVLVPRNGAQGQTVITQAQQGGTHGG
jgi:hypothetical protein